LSSDKKRRAGGLEPISASGVRAFGKEKETTTYYYGKGGGRRGLSLIFSLTKRMPGGRIYHGGEEERGESQYEKEGKDHHSFLMCSQNPLREEDSRRGGGGVSLPESDRESALLIEEEVFSYFKGRKAKLNRRQT